MQSVFLIALLALAAWGDIVRFKNGDQITGEWQRVNGSTLVFKSENLGEVTFSIARIKSMDSTRNSAILLKSGDAFRGMLSLLETGAWELKEVIAALKMNPEQSAAGQR